ncbi:MAG: DsbA family protein [Gemmatimonadetes bacterium]|nr:DsbA family protein [Gemmatimonadota bacterium]
MSGPTLTLPHGLLDPSRPLRPPVGPADRVRGDGPITMVIYADFECIDCRAFHTAFNQLPDDLRSQVRQVHRHYPLVSSRPRAMQSALAVEAAHVQGAFWQMYDRLLSVELDRAPRALDRIAEELGIDRPRFQDDLRNRLNADRIWAHVRSGRDSGVTGTPALFLEGVAYQPVVRADALEADLRAVLAALEG